MHIIALPEVGIFEWWNVDICELLLQKRCAWCTELDALDLNFQEREEPLKIL